MNVTRIRGERFRSYDEFDVVLPEGALAIVGSNGAGKSSLVEAIPLAIFGPEGRSLAPYLSEDEHDQALVLEVEFDHAGREYRIRRSFSPRGRGKPSLDFEQRNGIGWEPLSRETIAATEEEIQRVIGLSRETFCASAYLGQGRGGQFTEAQPRERKKILAEVLGLGTWERLLEAARSDKRTAEREHAELAGRIALLEETGSDMVGLEAECERLRSLCSELESEHAARRRELDDAAVAAQEAERAEATYREARSAYEAAKARLDQHAQIREDAQEATSLAAGVEDEIAALTTDLQLQQAILAEQEARDVVANVEGRIREWQAKRDAHAAAVFKRNDLLGRASAKNEEAEALRQAADRALAHVGEARCEVCEQVLGQEAAEATAKRYREQAETFDFTARELDAQAQAVEIPILGDEPERDTMATTRWMAAQAKLERARNDLAQRLRLEERLAGYEKTIAKASDPAYIAELEERMRAARAAAAALDELEEPEPGALDALRARALDCQAHVEATAARLDGARRELVRAEASLERAEKIALDLEAAAARREQVQGELDLLALLERAYGRDGIPSLIVEAQAIPQIEAEANRLLAELGTSYRVELRTQRERKGDGGLADTLDVVVIGDVSARAYETFSGGERTRINLALRISLARLLAHRRGAESKLLAIDEPEFLDEAGTAALASVLRGLEGEFERIVLVSHVPGLRDAFDQALEVEKVDGRSRVAA